MRKVLAVAALAVGLSLGTASPSSAVPLTLGVWADFSFLGLGGVNTFDYSSALPVVIEVVDCCAIGDEYRVSLDEDEVGIPTSDASDPLHDGELTAAFRAGADDPLRALERARAAADRARNDHAIISRVPNALAEAEAATARYRALSP